MDAFITWVCLGGGVVMMLIALVTIMRLQARTRPQDASEADLD
jgi:hypothetical protein